MGALKNTQIVMKKIAKLMLAAVAVVAAGSSFSVSARSMGENSEVALEAYNANKLPSDAKAFLRAYYGHKYLKDCEFNDDNGNYEVTMSDGTEVEFNSRGQVVEIEAADRQALSAAVIENILPSDAYAKLQEMGYASKIEKIEKDRRGYDIDLVKGTAVSELFFARDGKLVASR